MRFQEIYERCWTGYRQAGMKKKGDRQVPNCVPVEEVKTGPEMTLNDLLYTAAAKAIHQAGLEGIPMDYEEAIKKAAKIYRIPYTPSELPRLLAQRDEIDRKLAMLKQGKQVAKARRQAKLAPTPAGSEEWFKTHSPVADRIKPPTRTLEETEADLAEDLKKWFKEKWVRFGPDGKIRGDCARGSESEGKPKCLPQAKAHALGKKGRAAAAAKKRREDPNPERRGPARNVATKVKEVKDINAVRDLIKQSGASNAFQQAHNKEQQAMALLDQLKDLNAKNDPLSGYDQKYIKEVKRIVNAILDLGYEVEGPTNGQYTLRTKTWEDNTTVAEGFEYGSRVQHPKYGAGQVIKVYSNGVITVNFPNYPDPIDKKPGVQSNFAPGDKDYQSLKPVAEGMTDYQKRRQRERDIDAGRPVKPLPKNPKTDYQKRREQERRDQDMGEAQLDEKQDACYRKVKSRYKVWPSAYASGALVQCRKKGAANWGNKSKK